MKVGPQKEHAWLQQLVGEWTYESECSIEPGKPPEKFAGSETVHSLGGLWIVCEGRSEMPGGGMATTLMTLGYDPQNQAVRGNVGGIDDDPSVGVCRIAGCERKGADAQYRRPELHGWREDSRIQGCDRGKEPRSSHTDAPHAGRRRRMAPIDDGELPAEDLAVDAAPSRKQGSGIEGSIVVILVPVTSFYFLEFPFLDNAAWGRVIKIETTTARWCQT